MQLDRGILLHPATAANSVLCLAYNAFRWQCEVSTELGVDSAVSAEVSPSYFVSAVLCDATKGVRVLTRLVATSSVTAEPAWRLSVNSVAQRLREPTFKFDRTFDRVVKRP